MTGGGTGSTPGGVRVRPLAAADAAACTAIVGALADWFTPDVPRRVGADVGRLGGWAVTGEDGEVAGFAVVERRGGVAAEILWAAVHPDRRGGGLGTALVETVLDRLAAEGVAVVEVKTLDPSSPYEPYRATRAFWQARGFVHVDSVDPFPGWQAGNPAGVYVAALFPTVGVEAGDRLQAEVARLSAEVARLGTEVARLRADKGALLRRAAERDYERPPHYQ